MLYFGTSYFLTYLVDFETDAIGALPNNLRPTLATKTVVALESASPRPPACDERNLTREWGSADRRVHVGPTDIHVG